MEPLATPIRVMPGRRFLLVLLLIMLAVIVSHLAVLEADLFTPLCYLLALVALAANGERRLPNCVVAGIALAVAPFTAQPARFFTIALAGLLVLSFGRSLRGWNLAALVIPPLFATA